MLEELYFSDPRVKLLPIEHLAPTGLSDHLTRSLAARFPYGEELAAMLNRAFPLYWERSSALARRTRNWAPPRLRNIAVIDPATAIPPYVQLLNTSTWTLFDCDFAAATSSVELIAYLLVHGDRMSLTGEVTMAALHNGAYWFDRSEEELADFQQGAQSSNRPDAAAYAALAAAIPWMRRMGHETLRPPPRSLRHQSIPGTDLLVCSGDEPEAKRLVSTWTEVAKRAVGHYFETYRKPDRSELVAVLDWLRESTPKLLVTGRNNRILWDPEQPDRLSPLRNELRNSGAVTLRSIRQDLEVIDHHTRDFLARCSADGDLPCADESIAQDGYTYLYRGRRSLAYNLYEAHLDRLKVPGLPFARPMLGARAYHEWSHLAVEAGWVRTVVADAALAERIDALRDAFDETIAAAPETVRRVSGNDLASLRATYPAAASLDWGGEEITVAGDTNGGALLRMLLPRVADFKANLLASRMQRVDEREVYVRQNIRTLRPEYGREQVWRMFARYLYELQYLRFSGVENRRQYFLRSTWFDRDFLDTGIVDEEHFDRIDHAFGQVLDSFAIDTQKISA